ncbi:MAG: glycosyltransferase [Candidatus Binatia bacterium]
MRILQIVHGFPPDAWAGTELVTFYLAQSLHARGHEVTVLTRTEDRTVPELTIREERNAGFSVVRVVNNHTQTTTFRSFYENSFYDDFFREFLTRRQPDVVHFQHIAHFSTSLVPLAVASGFPTILSLHDFFFPCYRIHLIDAAGQLCSGPEGGSRCAPCLRGIASPEDIRHRLVAMEQAMAAAQQVLTPSDFLQERMTEYFPALTAKLRTVSLGVKPVVAPLRQRQGGAPLRILYSGLLFPPKGAHILLEALQGLPADAVEVSLYGASLPYWQAYVDQLHRQAQGFTVRFAGVYAHGQLDKVLSAHDLLVMPMICEETFSLVVREALMAGLPVVAARRGALPAVIQHEMNGLLFEPEDAADLRRCLQRLLFEPGLYKRLCSHVPQYRTVDEYAAEMEEIYQAMLNGEKGEKGKRVKGETEEKNIIAPLPHCPIVSPPRPVTQPVSVGALTVSVLIPTKNGATYLAEVLSAIHQQRGDFRLCEIIAVDSGSHDTTLQILQQHGVTIIQIPPQEFGHGKTRNLLASRAQGEALVFLTQDATPANDRWLHNLLAPLYTDDTIVGVYSRQQPRQHCHPMEWHRIVEYEFQGQLESRVHALSAEQSGEQNRYLSRFFANSSSVIRRAVWEQIPFPDVAFAEDQAWADRVLKAGYKTAYAADSLVVHSHGYGVWPNFCRHFEHAVAMQQLFADPPQRSLWQCFPAALQIAKLDLIFWRRYSGESKYAVLRKWGLPAISWHVAGNLGYWLGEQSDRLPRWLVRRLSLQERMKRG